MKRSLRFLVLLIVSLVLAAFIPLCVERTLTRSWRVDQNGDTIEWGWRLCSLNEYWSKYRYLSREQSPSLWLAVNIALVCVYAVAITIVVEWFLTRRSRMRSF